MRNRGSDHARWLQGMRQLQAQLGSLERARGVASAPWTTARCRSACGRASRGCRSLLGGQAAGGVVVEEHGVVASFVPAAPDSPTLNAAIAMEPYMERRVLNALRKRYDQIGIRRWGVWTDGGEARRSIAAPQGRRDADHLLLPRHGRRARRLNLNGHAPAGPSDLATVGHVNDLAYGNPDGRLERTLAPLPRPAARLQRRARGPRGERRPRAPPRRGLRDLLRGDRPYARRQGLAADVMARVALDAQRGGLTSTSLQATELGEKLYRALGYRRVSDMQLWERRR